jgi:hypothetical protein
MRTMIDGVGTLSDEHSGDGLPVLLMDSNGDEPREPGDPVEVKGVSQLAWRIVEEWMDWTKPEGRDRKLAERFVQLGKAAAD